MSIINLYTVSENTILKNDETFLCVFDESGKLIGDYDFCTGLRLLKKSNRLIIYVNDADLISGSWTLFLTELDENLAAVTTKIEGSKEGSPSSRHFINDNPWDNCSPGYEHVTIKERQERVAICAECPLLDRETMKCTISGKLVLDVTTKADEFCPEELWGDKQRVLSAISERALAQGLVPDVEGPVVTTNDQALFESELDDFLENL